MYNKIAILYSFEQKCFHTETLRQYCQSNIVSSQKKKPHQFRLIGVADNDEHASQLIKEIQQKFNW